MSRSDNSGPTSWPGKDFGFQWKTIYETITLLQRLWIIIHCVHKTANHLVIWP